MELSVKSKKGNGQSWRKRQVWIYLIGLLLVAGGVAVYLLRGTLFPSTNTTSSSNAPAYYTATVRRGNIQIAATGTGTLTPNTQENLSFSTSGVVQSLNVKVGSQVTAGQVLAKLTGIDNLQASVSTAQLSLLKAQQTLATLNSGAGVNMANAYKAMTDAQTAYETALTAQQRTAYARCGKTTNTQLTARFKLATDNLNKIAIRDYGSDAWINAKNNYDQAYANLQYCLAYTPDELASTKSTLDVAKSTLDQATLTYNNMKNGSGIDPNTLALDQAQVDQAQIQLNLAQQNLAGATITAPVSGKIISIAGSVGESVDTSTFIVMTDIQNPTVTVQVDETQLSNLAIGNVADTVFDALPGTTYTGKISQISPILTTSGQYQLATAIITLDKAPTYNGQPLPLGVTGTVTVISKQALNVLVVPIDAVRDLGGGTFGAFVVDPNTQKLVFTPVVTGLQDTASNLVEIKSGLQQGETVSTGSVQTTGG